MPVQSFIYPDLSPSIAGFNIMHASEMSFSRVSGIESVSENAGEKWHIQLKYSVLTKEEAFELKAHLQELRGSVNKSLIKEPSFTQRGAWSGTPRVKGAGQYGLYVDVDGFIPNTLQVRKLDRFKLAGRVHSVTKDATSDPSGNARIYVANEIIQPSIDNDLLVFDESQLTIACRWTKPEEIKQLQGNRRIYRNVNLSFIEALA